jgi:hypothetical protein
MKKIFNIMMLVLFIITTLLLGWGSIIKSFNGLTYSGYYQSQAQYMCLAHI